MISDANLSSPLSRSKLNRSLVTSHHSRSEGKLVSLRPTTAVWKAKVMQKRLEAMQKTQSELVILNEKRRKIHENQSIVRVLTEERKDLLEYNEILQAKINNCIFDMQVIRRSNENLHQESLRLARHTAEMMNEESALKKEKGDLEKEIEKLQKEIALAAKNKTAAEANFLQVYDKTVKIEAIVEENEKKLGLIESLKAGDVESSRKTQKEIKKLRAEIAKLMKSRQRLGME